MPKLSVLIPVYNEEKTLQEIIRRVKNVNFDKEIIIVNDASTDRTGEILKTFNDPEIKIFHHERNMGKGAGIRTAVAKATGDFVIIQDADLEYDPADYLTLLGPLIDGRADVVYGSRFLGGPHRVLLFWHYLANLFFTLITNVLYNVNLTDMGTCYKVFRREVIQSMNIKSNGFGLEPEITAKICKKKLRLYETPISYSGRTYEEGKKISWIDSFVYLGALLRFRFLD